MRTLSAGALVLIAALLALAPPARSAPSHAETGVFVVHALPRSSDSVPFGLTEAQHASESGAKWASIYVDWKALQPGGPGDSLKAQDSAAAGQLAERLSSFKNKGLKVNITFLGTPQWASGNANPYYPPNNPADFGDFVKKLATEHGANIDGYELGNEPDGGVFWLPKADPKGYAAYAQAGVDALKAADPSAIKFVGGLVGGNAAFMEQVLNAGLNGFDAVAFHSGTACKLDPPTFYNRQNAFIQATSTTAYRELIHLLKSRGMNPTVADTAAGWSTSPGLCNSPGIAADKKGGVDEAKQAQYLREYFGCIENDPELKYAFIFSLYDLDNTDKWDHRMGLRSAPPGLGAKQSFGAMQSVFGGGSVAKDAGCGGYVDHEAPDVVLTTSSPVVGGVPIFSGPLQLTAKGTDEHPVRAVRIEVNGKNIPGSTKDGTLHFDAWQGAKDLKNGEHTVTATAEDEAGNTSKPTTLKVKKVSPNQMPLTATQLTAKVVRVKGRKVTIKGKLSWPKGLVKPSGRVRIWFKRGKFVSKYGVTPSKPFTKTFTLRKPGKWKVSVFYDNKAPFKASRVKPFTVKVS
jgi:hypothetical protein